MKKVASLAAISALALGLAACGETRNERTLSGALIGTGAGAAIGGLATGSATGALVGGAIGAGTGAIIGSESRGPRRYRRAKCFEENRYGERIRVPCD
ncbi:cell envelope biogenesis protein OmpA [Chelatococcus sambhunathii]|uniref:Cell envelope biogenesis protein OmpA n=1 Tax=Chelatococcus sambhunathii TaxID=363953 RepID=A0ABU1DFY2_9HYPH|nr:YMGG-like glycine zipper-containing protein [Chelatococcus sambhunathii]MDR4307007.1 cell envelope biogenesis protein OmpA [Chelatococcus sambhunathii]